MHAMIASQTLDNEEMLVRFVSKPNGKTDDANTTVGRHVSPLLYRGKINNFVQMRYGLLHFTCGPPVAAVNTVMMQLVKAMNKSSLWI